MAQDAVFDRDTGCVGVIPGKPATIGLMLTRGDCKRVKIAALDPATDAVLAQSKNIPVKLVI